MCFYGFCNANAGHGVRSIGIRPDPVSIFLCENGTADNDMALPDE